MGEGRWYKAHKVLSCLLHFF